MGFLGMLIILRPGIIDISIGIYMALISSLIWSVVIILTKKVSKDDSAITILSHQYVYMSLFSFPLVIYFWDQPSLKTIIFILCAAMSGTILHIALNHAYKLVDVCKKKISEKESEITENGKASWMEVECLGACVNAPMIQINDDYFEDLNEEKLEKIIDQINKNQKPKPGSYRGRLSSEPENIRKTLLGNKNA